MAVNVMSACGAVGILPYVHNDEGQRAGYGKFQQQPAHFFLAEIIVLLHK